MSMINNYDIFKNGLFKLFDESVYSDLLIDIENLEPELKNIDKNNLYDEETSQIIENSQIIKLMVKHLKNNDVKIYFDFSEMENIREAYYNFLGEFKQIYKIIPYGDTWQFSE